MICPKCKSEKIKTLESQPHKNDTRKRRRQCLACGHRFNTIEYIDTTAQPGGGTDKGRCDT